MTTDKDTYPVSYFGFPLNHQRHWAPLLGLQDPTTFLHDVLNKVVARGAKSIQVGDHFHMIDGTRPLMFSALLRKDEDGLALLAMYPYAESPEPWPFQVSGIEEDESGLQARRAGSCNGLTFGVFDTLYLRTRSEYPVGSIMPLHVSAIAYHIADSELPPGYAPEFVGYGPMDMFTQEPCAVDEVGLLSIIEDTTEFDFWGVRLRLYVMPMPTLGDTQPRLLVFANPAVCTRQFAPGDRVMAGLWFFGMAPKPGTSLAF